MKSGRVGLLPCEYVRGLLVGAESHRFRAGTMYKVGQVNFIKAPVLEKGGERSLKNTKKCACGLGSSSGPPFFQRA